MSSRIFFCAVVLFCLTASDVRSELLPQDQSIHSVINHYVANRIAAEKIPVADVASDAEILRRLTLDIAGRIPTVAEIDLHKNLNDIKNREKLVDQLINSPDYAYHLRNKLEPMLMGKHGSDGDLRNYLLKAARENWSWDRIFRDSMIGDESNPDQKPALVFIKKRIGDIDALTNDTSRIFFGVSINCAQCHDHPLVADWYQDHYFGFRSFLNRTYATKKNTLAEKYTDELKFKTTEGKEKVAKIMFLSGEVVEEPKVEKTKEQLKQEDEEVKKQMKDDKAPPPKPPEFRPREKLVEIALRTDGKTEPFLAKSIVNRTWARYFSRGLVHPLDQLHSENPASHPELLQWLTRDFIKHKYDMQRLIRGIVLSEPYLRSSSWASDAELPADRYFARMVPRVMTPRQYTMSLNLATISPKHQVLPTDEAWTKKREDLENQSNGMASQIEMPGEHFQVSVDEALLFSNNDRVRNEYLRDGNDRLVGYLKEMVDNKEVITAAFLSVFSRPPNAEELAAFESYLSKRGEDRLEGIKQIVWALIASPEIRFVY